MSAAQGSAPAGVSVVIPVFNERDNLPLLHERLVASLAPLGRPWEILYVDDGSFDGSTELLEGLAASEPRVRAIVLARNFGQTPALAAGIDHASHDVIVTMDADLQNDPADIPRLLATLEEGWDVVSGWRRDRQDDELTRILPSRIANRIISYTTQVQLHDYGCGIKAYRAEIARSLKLYGEMHRFLPAIAGDLGARVTEIEVRHRARTRGRSKYGLSRTVRVLLDLLTVKFLSDFSTRPIQVFGLLGLAGASVGGLLMLILGFQRVVLGVQLGNRPIVLLAILLVVAGLQFITFGLLGEMLARTYHESQGKPIYVIRDVLE